MPWGMVLRKGKRRAFVVGIAGVLVAFTAACPARAEDVHVTANVHPGRLVLGTPRDVTSGWQRAHGLRETLLTVTDARGNGKGWRLDGDPVGPRPVWIRELRLRCAAGSTCTLPGDSPSLRATLPANAQTLLLASPKGTGMGRIEVAVTGTGFPLRFSLRAG